LFAVGEPYRVRVAGRGTRVCWRRPGSQLSYTVHCRTVAHCFVFDVQHVFGRFLLLTAELPVLSVLTSMDRMIESIFYKRSRDYHFMRHFICPLCWWWMWPLFLTNEYSPVTVMKGRCCDWCVKQLFCNTVYTSLFSCYSFSWT